METRASTSKEIYNHNKGCLIVCFKIFIVIMIFSIVVSWLIS